MNRKNALYPYLFDQSITTAVVVACLNDFCKNIKKKTVVVMDNSRVSKNAVFGLNLLPGF